MEKNIKKPIKIVVTGPESTGKSTLSRHLAERFDTVYVPEYAREYLEKTNGAYQQEDLLNIARGQIKTEDELAARYPLLVCDTSLEVIRVWSEWKYGNCDDFILTEASRRKPDLFLLLKPDLPWEPDPLRENPDDREALFVKYQQTLEEYGVTTIEIGGNYTERTNRAIQAVEELLTGTSPNELTF